MHGKMSLYWYSVLLCLLIVDEFETMLIVVEFETLLIVVEFETL